MSKKKKAKRWVKLRHKVITAIAYVILYPYAILRYGIRIEPYHGGRRPYLILLNHQTPFDQFFVGISFRRAIYYLATEDIFSMGWISSVIRYLVAPIPIKKQTTDITAIRSCMQVVREGGSIAIAPEGNRTYSGKTEYMSPSIAPLARRMGMPIALYRIEGGYGTQPRWSDVIRKGRMRAYVSRVIEPEEYAAMTDEALYEAIRTELTVNEGALTGEFHHKKRAEYLERALYVCPDCGLSTFESHLDTVRCTKCGRTVRYLPTKELEGVGASFPFRFMTEWYDYQCDFINALDTRAYTDEPLYQDTADVLEVVIQKRKYRRYRAASVALYGDRMVVTGTDEGGMTLPFDRVYAVSVLGRNKLNVYDGKQVWQFKGSKRFNALKYVHIYYRNKNITGGNENDKFLGL